MVSAVSTVPSVQVVLVTAAQVNPWLQLYLGRELLVLAVT